MTQLSRERAGLGTRVCVIGSGWRFTSGISYYTCRVAEALAGAGEQVSVILMRRLIPRALYPGRDRVGVAVNAIDYPPLMPVFDGVDWFWGLSIVRAARFLRRERPAVVIFEWWTGAVLHTYLLLALLARRQGAHLVLEFHEIQDTGEARISGVAGYTALFLRLLVSWADGCVVHSDHDRRAVLDVHPRVRGKVHVVPHGPYDHHTRPHDERAAVRNDEFTLLFFGTIRPYKGLEHLIAAFDSLLPEQASQFRLVVVGETWEGWTEPIDAIAASPYRDRIELTNRYVTDAEVQAAFDDADAVVLPYLRSAASGPLHIAMAAGLPVVLSDVGGLRDGAAGYDGITWVPPGDVGALRDALLDVASMRGARFTDARSWKHTAARFREIIDGLRPR